MEQGVIAGSIVSVAWILLQIAWMHVRPAADRLGAMVTGYVASLPFVLIFAPQTAIGLFHAYFIHLLLFFFYVQCFYHIERSVTFRLLVELLKTGKHGLPLSALQSRYSVTEMIEQRMEVLHQKGFLDRQGDVWTLKPKGLLLARATVAARQGVLKRRDQTPENTREQEALNTLSALADQITDADSSKLKALVATLQSIGVGPKSETRVVVFSERVDTVRWLGETLPKLLGVPAGAIATLHAGLADTDQMSRIEDFSLADKPVRVLVTTDISSEGVNLHRQCHQLIHFDVPWSLITVQQRNGRIDRYGQRHRPEIRALLLSSRQQAGIVSDEHRVASRLLEREDEARRTLGDVAPILGKYSAIEEERLILNDLADGRSATEIVPDTPAGGFDLLTFLTQGVAKPPEVPVADAPRLVDSDWTFLKDALAETAGPSADLDLVIDEARKKILLDCVRSAANAHIHAVGCLARPVKRLVNTARDEVECRAAFHLDGRARVMSQDESWNVIGWVVPPPAFPVHVGPGTANRSEHVSSENPGAHILEAPRSEVVIDPGCATVGAK